MDHLMQRSSVYAHLHAKHIVSGTPDVTAKVCSVGIALKYAIVHAWPIYPLLLAVAVLWAIYEFTWNSN